MTAVYERMNISIEIHPTSGARSLALAASGQTDGDIVRIGTVKHLHPSLRQVPVPTLDIEGYVFVKNEDRDTILQQDLSKLRVGRLNGVVQAELFSDGFEQLTTASSEEELFSMLAEGRLDAVVGDSFDGPLHSAKLGLTNIVPLARPFQVEPMFHYVHEKHEHLVPEIANVLAAMRGSGELEQITADALATLEEEAGERGR